MLTTVDKRSTETSRQTNLSVEIVKCGYCLAILACLLLSSGCVSKKKAAAEAQRAYQAGFEQGEAAAEIKQTHVFVSGPVQRRQIIWHPDLTVAQAIVEAGIFNPSHKGQVAQFIP